MLIKKNLTRYLIVVSLTIIFSLGVMSSGYARTLKVWDWWSPSAAKAFEKWFSLTEKLVKKRYPEIEDVEYQFVPFGRYFEKFLSAAAAGETPDVMQSSIIWARELYERGALLKLNKYVKKTPSITMDDFFDVSLRYNMKNGDIFGIPFNYAGSCIEYNIDLFKEAGLDPSPETLATWQDLLRCAKKLTKYDSKGKVVRAGYYAVAFDYIEHFTSWLYSSGGKFYKKGYREVAFNTRDAVEVLEFQKKLLYDEKVSLPLAPGREPISLFAAEKAAIKPGGIWEGRYIKEKVPEMNFMMTFYPAGPTGGKKGATNWVNMQVIPKAAKNPDLGWKWIKLYVSMEHQKRMMDIIRFEPARKKYYQTKAWEEIVEEAPYLRLAPKIAASGGVYPFVKFEEVNDAIGPILNSVLLNKMGIKEALDKAEQEANRILKAPY